MNIIKEVLIYDIECATYGASVRDISKHRLKYFGYYSYKTNTSGVLTSKSKIQKLISDHKILIGFNVKNYDNFILEADGLKLNYKTIIDLHKIIKQRAGLIPIENSFLSYILKSYSLDNIVKTLGLVEEGKKNIDYKIFNIESPTKEQLELIEEYTLRDIEITKKLFEWVNNQFDSWKHNLDEYDQAKLKHLSCSTGVYTYKVICNRVGVKEEYENIEDRQYQGEGGYVSYPGVEKLEGNIYCLDFASLYPHIMIQCNLYGRNKLVNEGWNGNGRFNVIGHYDNKNMSKVSEVLMDMYNERVELKKKKDDKQYGLKIALNTCYGILRNPVFKNVYDNVAGRDCCLIGQQWVKFARRKFKDAGYLVFYTDTDSVYLQDSYDDVDKILQIKEEIIKEIKENVPFPVDTFDMGIDYKIDYIQFFKGGNKLDDSLLDDEDIVNKELGLMKKNYLFIYSDNDEKKMFIKNLGIVKRTNSPLSKKIFWEKISPHAIKTHSCKFTMNDIKQWINDYLKDDIMLISKRLTVQNKNTYKSQNSIQVQAYDYKPTNKDEILGEGIHYFIPNTRIGIGKGMVKYCTIDEFTKLLTVNDLYLHGVIRELKYFISDYVIHTQKKIKEVSFKDTLKQMGLW